MIACLENKVDLRICGEPIEDVFYLDDLPGITVKRVNAAASEEQETVSGVMKAVKRNASRRILQDLNIAQQYWSPQTIKVGAAGFYNGVFTPQTPAAGWRGVSIQSYSSRYSGLYVKTISYFATAPGALEILVYDPDAGMQVNSFTWNVLAGHNTLVHNTSYAIAGSARRLLFLYDSALHVPTLTPLYEGCNCGLDCTMGGCCGYHCGQYRIAGIESENSLPIAANLKETNYSYGLRIDFDIRCMLEMYVCANENSFLDAYINLCAMLLLQEIRHSDRLNRYVVLGMDKKIELEKQYREQYEASLLRLKDVQFLGDKCCYQCPAKIIATYSNP